MTDPIVRDRAPRPVRPLRRLLLGLSLLALVLFTTGASGVFAFVICDGCGSQRPTLNQLPQSLEEGPPPPADPNPKAVLLPPASDKNATAK
jgi:hypothetical protein